MRQFRTMLFTAAWVILVWAVAASCKKDFGAANTNPSVVVNPDIRFLLTHAEDTMEKYQYTEWIWESMEQLLRFTQHITTDPYELTANTNTRYSVFYLDMLPHLFEIRKQIATYSDKENYQKMGAVTYVLQILHGIKVSDMNGSIPYSKAVEGRSEFNFSPAYDPQETLFANWLSQLDSSIAILSDQSLPNQTSYGSADVLYQSDWTKWVMLANSLKLRIAARLEWQNPDKTKELFQQVIQDPTGPIVTDDAQLSYQNPDYFAFGFEGAISYRSQRFATSSIIKFLKSSSDPRIAMYFEKNGLQGSFRDTLTKYGATLPSFIDLNDPYIMYQGGPADFTVSPGIATYIKNPFPVGNSGAGHSVSTYFLISPINTRFFAPSFNNVITGLYKDVIVTSAENDFLIAEFIQKGYGAGIDTRGTAEEWYNKGIASSLTTMNAIAQTAGLETGFATNASATISNYQNNPEVKFNGVNDLERIYVQQYINLFRNPNEAFVFCRRTGYPKNGSAYYSREPFNETVPRRFWTIDPGEVNRANWQAAMNDQGFTPNAQDLNSLSTQRIWYDKPAPDFGEGN